MIIKSSSNKINVFANLKVLKQLRNEEKQFKIVLFIIVLTEIHCFV